MIFGTGRQPNTDQLGLENTKVALDEKGYVKVDKFQNTTQNGIYAVGDVIGKIDLTPVAIAAGRRLSERLFNGQTDLYLDYNLVPTVVFTHPPVATIGLTEKAALEEYGEDQVKIYRSSFTPMYFALGEYRQKCDMKLICVGKEEKLSVCMASASVLTKCYKALQSLLKWARPKLILIILLRFIQQDQKNL